MSLFKYEAKTTKWNFRDGKVYVKIDGQDYYAILTTNDTQKLWATNGLDYAYNFPRIIHLIEQKKKNYNEEECIKKILEIFSFIKPDFVEPVPLPSIECLINTAPDEYHLAPKTNIKIMYIKKGCLWDAIIDNDEKENICVYDPNAKEDLPKAMNEIVETYENIYQDYL